MGIGAKCEFYIFVYLLFEDQVVWNLVVRGV